MLFAVLSRTARTLLTVSDYSKRRLARRLRVRPERLHVVHNGADHLHEVEPDKSVFPYFGIEPHSYVLAVGSSNPNKNLPRLERAVRRLHEERGLRLVLVGGINSRVFAHSEADDLGARPDVVRTGPISDGQLKALYQNAIALVFPSLYEGFGLPPLEAMSCGCPVLAANAAAIPEVCGDGVAYFDPYSVADIERSVRLLLDNPERRAELQAAGFARVKTFSWTDSARTLLGHARAAL
jgi:glycosyltransferase involved in cell wall biosynthesis